MIVKIKLSHVDLEAKDGSEGGGLASQWISCSFGCVSVYQGTNDGNGAARTLAEEGLGITCFQMQIPHSPGGGDVQVYKTWSRPSRSLRSC